MLKPLMHFIASIHFALFFASISAFSAEITAPAPTTLNAPFSLVCPAANFAVAKLPPPVTGLMSFTLLDLNNVQFDRAVVEVGQMRCVYKNASNQNVAMYVKNVPKGYVCKPQGSSFACS